MSLSCVCTEDWGDDPGQWAYFSPEYFSVFRENRRKRCCSCNDLINIGTECLKFRRERRPYTEIEERIMGEEIPIAPWWMCEKCGEQFLNLTELGYCVNLGDNMFDLLKQYHELTGFSGANQGLSVA